MDKAPYDAANTDLKNKSLDASISTNTLEHIPHKDIVNIFTELRRTLKDNGVVSLSIDYSDHYAHTDKKISLLNFLKYDDKTWNKFNHKHHYQIPIIVYFHPFYSSFLHYKIVPDILP